MTARLASFKCLTLLFLIAISIKGYAQSPQGFSYQAVIRNSNGQPIANQSVKVRILLTDKLATTTYYEEQHTTLTTNSLGAANLTIGEGTLKQGTIDAVPWQSGEVYIKVEVDPTGTSGYQAMGQPVKLYSVPYALFAENAKEVVSQPTALDDDPIFVVKNKAGQIVFAVYQTGVRVYVEDTPVVKGARGGFAVGGLSQTKAGTSDEYLRITSDSARINFKNPIAKGARGGFAVGGLSQTKGITSNYFNIETGDKYIINPTEARILWYPLKHAFLTGDVLVLDPNDVGQNSFSSGFESKAKGQYSQALGYKAYALGNYSTAIGNNAIARLDGSFAFGDGADAANTNSYAFGKSSLVNGLSSFAFGEDVTAGLTSANSYAFAFGKSSFARASSSYAFGDNASTGASATNSYAFGQLAQAIGVSSYALGKTAIANGTSSYAFGDGATTDATASNSFAFGKSAQANGNSSYALGDGAKAAGNGSFAFGSFGRDTATFLPTTDPTSATGNYSFAIGLGAKALGISSTAMGILSYASGDASTAIGVSSRAEGSKSLAFNSGQAIGVASLAFGYYSKAQGDYSIAIGRGISKFGGVYNLASGDYSIALGYSRVSGRSGIGIGTTDVVAERGVGIGVSIDVNSYNAVAVGYNNVDPGTGATTPILTDPIFMVGNGFTGTPSNALTILKNGNAGIGITAPTHILHINGQGRSTSASWATTSDIRLKDIKGSYNYGLQEILKLKAVRFNYKKDNPLKLPSDIEHVGIIAQELKEVIPEAVTLNSDGYYTVSTDPIFWSMLNAIKEQQRKIEQLEEKVKELDSLKAELESIKALLKK